MKQHTLAIWIVILIICTMHLAAEPMDKRAVQLASSLKISIDSQGNIPKSTFELSSKLPLKFDKYLLKQKGARAPDKTVPINAEILNNNDIVVTGCFLTCASFNEACNTLLRKLVMNSMPIELVLEKYELSPEPIGDLCIVEKRFDMTDQTYIPGDIHFVHGSTMISLRSETTHSKDIYEIAKALDTVLKSWDMLDDISPVWDFSAAISPKERETGIAKLSSQYTEIEGKLLNNLNKECQSDRKDKSYFSPLHAAIQAVRVWHVARADDALLEGIDYTLDQSSWADGLTVSDDSFYPAARPLVELRVDLRKVIKAIRQTDNEKRIKLLSWVLTERLGRDLSRAAKHIRSELEQCDSQHEKDNLTHAIELLGKARHSDDLLQSGSKNHP